MMVGRIMQVRIVGALEVLVRIRGIVVVVVTGAGAVVVMVSAIAALLTIAYLETQRSVSSE